MNFNPCINEDFEDETRILSMPELVKNTCGFCEKIVDITNCEMLKEIKQIHEENMKNVEKVVMKILEDQRHSPNSTESLKIAAEKNEAFKLEISSIKTGVEKNELEIEKQENLSTTESLQNLQIDAKTLMVLKSTREFLKDDFENKKQISKSTETKEKEDSQKVLEDKTADNLKLEAQIKGYKDEMALKEEFYQKLDVQKSAIFTEKIQELSKENDNLKAQIQILIKQKFC